MSVDTLCLILTAVVSVAVLVTTMIANRVKLAKEIGETNTRLEVLSEQVMAIKKEMHLIWEESKQFREKLHQHDLEIDRLKQQRQEF